MVATNSPRTSAAAIRLRATGAQASLRLTIPMLRADVLAADPSGFRVLGLLPGPPEPSPARSAPAPRSPSPTLEPAQAWLPRFPTRGPLPSVRSLSHPPYLPLCQYLGVPSIVTPPHLADFSYRMSDSSPRFGLSIPHVTSVVIGHSTRFPMRKRPTPQFPGIVQDTGRA
jgi:hypothetical protein